MCPFHIYLYIIFLPLLLNVHYEKILAPTLFNPFHLTPGVVISSVFTTQDLLAIHSPYMKIPLIRGAVL